MEKTAKVSSIVVRDSLRRSGPGTAFLRDDSWMQDEEGRLRRRGRPDVRLPCRAGRCCGGAGEAAAPQPSSDGTMVYLNCDGELDGTIARVPGAGGTILMRRTPVPGGLGAFACLKDSEGNHVGLHTAF